MEMEALGLPLAGGGAGIILGYVSRRSYFCTLSALERHWYGGNSDGVRSWALAALVAMILTQGLVALGLFSPQTSFLMVGEFHWLSAVIGGLMFGFGMALIGTCAFGALVRLGGGSLKSLMAILVLGIVALSAQRGLFGHVRMALDDAGTLDLGFAGGQSMPQLAAALFGPASYWLVVLGIIGGLAFWVFRDASFRANRSAVVSGTVVGAVIAFGWLATGTFHGRSLDPVQVESASFVAPLSDVLLQFSLSIGDLPDYGVGLVIGVVLGAIIAARQADDVRWEACDDARELSRHITGAAMMGVGGVLALGCTIGQGVSAASLLTVSAPVVMVSILIGARLGLAYLLEGSVTAVLKSE